MEGNTKVCVIVPDGTDHIMRCKRCRKVFGSTKGKYMLGLIIRENAREYRYFVGVNPPIHCCGEKKAVIQTFDSDAEADAEMKRLLEYFESHHSTAGLELIAFSHFGLN